MSILSRRGFLLGSVAGAASVGLSSSLVRIEPASAEDISRYGDPSKAIDSEAVPIMGTVPGMIICEDLNVDIPAVTQGDTTHVRNPEVTFDQASDGQITITAQMKAYPKDEIELQVMLTMFETYMNPQDRITPKLRV